MPKVSSELHDLRLLADSDNWHSREDAGYRLRDLVEDDPPRIIALTQDWVTDTSEYVRRAACLGCLIRKGRKLDASLWPPILDRLAILMGDRSAYVRKCCGPFVVGILGWTYPDVILPWLKTMAARSDEQVRWNVASAFTQTLGRRFPDEAITLLRQLAADDRKLVRGAVRAALRNVAKAKTPASTEAEAILSGIGASRM
ncbi:hypothetical protein G5V57_23775 [Nordella sp. HKS 07]|uniref:DNA alkylation repair protein n=1 Tax=Nordella sp. HKS 07 TaxID=2712222 RepID=UPI0013E107AE|nr:DNA alkylation repair protein [Nordella sp. HKS 07]QIG50481.1 hypothetical protein G5V57_23775 [Nordella sp. HKS 07]